MIRGETVRHGAPHPGAPLTVLHSAAGYYIGYVDENGEPYTRESKYYPDYARALFALENDVVAWRE